MPRTESQVSFAKVAKARAAALRPRRAAALREAVTAVLLWAVYLVYGLSPVWAGVVLAQAGVPAAVAFPAAIIGFVFMVISIFVMYVIATMVDDGWKRHPSLGRRVFDWIYVYGQPAIGAVVTVVASRLLT
jgi:hypothetical protein